MTQALSKTVTFDEFIEWYPENSEHKYELHDGVIVEVPKPTGPHSEVAGLLNGELFIEIRRSSLPYFIPKECVIKPRDNGGYEPDIIVLDKQQVGNHESRWKKESIITRGDSIRLIVEVVSTNWEDDYALKLEEYESFGICEYWIVDYLALGGRRFIGNPKQKTISVYSLVEGIYQLNQFRGDDRIVSPTFPGLTLTARQVFDAGS
ncbi:Uma2 family endonuclease [Scytonema sp. UIC 10036]|uniref:Uma2 family endonuclease n=1 Tax=Scytonema sp. UIC 10036 TaxID=2304196 RepID=UPI0012DAF128|nr:Uma2 family endonuclease [Scytonema sp. UIC 10036]MUG97647.1 Uma2 family endonuclease [Scytonema sp. UIC 10036]